tara:strand:+ start:2213 stop:2488 length:276 start_codon:yes stop_codon:yes gene_type:complete
MARLLSFDKTITEKSVFPENDTFTLKEMYKYTNSTIVEFVYLNGHIMIIDEEGKLNNKPINDIATHYFRKYNKTHDFIVGDVLICDKSEIK